MSMDKYEVLEHIGDGAFDSGLLMRHEVGKKYLLKKIQLEPQTDRSHRSSLKEAGGDGGGVLNRRKVPALSAASSVRSLCRVPAQHLVSILAVFADVLAGNKATPVATAQLVTIMQPEGISPTVGSNGSLSHATDSLIVRMIVLNRSGDEHDLRRSFRCSFRTWLMTQVTVSTYGLFHIRHNQNYLTNSIEDSVCDIVIGLFLDTILYQHLTVAFLEHLYMLEL
nr:uncharacterized protein LOC127314161 isoform X7 [Lolium perenne]